MYGDTFLFDFDRPHSAKAVVFVRPWRKVRMAVTSELAYGVPVTPTNENPNMRRLSLRNTERLNGYGRTDVRVTWSTLGHWEFYGELINLFNERNYLERMRMNEPGLLGGPIEHSQNIYAEFSRMATFGIRVAF